MSADGDVSIHNFSQFGRHKAPQQRYDLVVAGMVMIGLIGLALDLMVRQLEKFDEVKWGIGQR